MIHLHYFIGDDRRGFFHSDADPVFHDAACSPGYVAEAHAGGDAGRMTVICGQLIYFFKAADRQPEGKPFIPFQR